MDKKLLEFFYDMRIVRRKLKQLKEQYGFCGIVFLDVKSETFLFTEQKLREVFEDPNSRILQSSSFESLNEFVRNLYQTEETDRHACPYDFTNIKVEDEQGSYWVQLYACKWTISCRRKIAGIIWIKLEEKEPGQKEQEKKEPGRENGIAGNYWIQKSSITDKYLKDTSDNYLFEWNIADDRLLLSENWNSKFSARGSGKRLNGQMIEWYIVKEDIPRFHKLQNDIMNGESPEDILLRFYIKDDKHDYAWCNVSFLSILCDDRTPMYVVGRVRDIDKKLRGLRHGNDSFYTSNRREARQKIDKLLAVKESEKIHALLVIRLNMNEAAKNEETFWGESAISYSLVKNLTYMIYPTDILLVHDNYMVVFLGDMGNEENVLRKAARIHKVFESMIPENVFAEIGIALWPRDGKTYEELLMYAEKPMIIKAKWFETEFAGEETDGPGEAAHEKETFKNQEQWPISVVSDIMDDWYHMLYMNSRLKRQMELAESQIMLGQIKPHFIFNALANIKALIYTDPDLAEKLIIAFTKYLRTHLNALGKEEMARFPDILDFVDNYIQVEQSRFPGKIKVVYDIQYDEFQMPHFIIQPLVENAIKHGLCKKNGTGRLRIASYQAGDEICIEIEDDGIGFDRMPERAVDSGIGLENVRKRLSYLLDGSLALHSEPGKGTRAVIRFKERQT